MMISWISTVKSSNSVAWVEVTGLSDMFKGAQGWVKGNDVEMKGDFAARAFERGWIAAVSGNRMTKRKRPATSPLSPLVGTR